MFVLYIEGLGFFGLYGQCIAPEDIAFVAGDWLETHDVITKRKFDNNSSYLRVDIDSIRGSIAHIVLPFRIEKNDSLFTGIMYTKSGISEYFEYHKDGKLNGPFFYIRRDGFYSTGTCINNNCNVLEYYPNGALYAKYSTVSIAMKKGVYVGFDLDGRIIYKAEYKIVPFTKINYEKYSSEFSEDSMEFNQRFLQIKIFEECPPPQHLAK